MAVQIREKANAAEERLREATDAPRYSSNDKKRIECREQDDQRISIDCNSFKLANSNVLGSACSLGVHAAMICLCSRLHRNAMGLAVSRPVMLSAAGAHMLHSSRPHDRADTSTSGGTLSSLAPGQLNSHQALRREVKESTLDAEDQLKETLMTETSEKSPVVEAAVSQCCYYRVATPYASPSVSAAQNPK